MQPLQARDDHSINKEPSDPQSKDDSVLYNQKLIMKNRSLKMQIEKLSQKVEDLQLRVNDTSATSRHTE
jgi:hypothetical protein